MSLSLPTNAPHDREPERNPFPRLAGSIPQELRLAPNGPRAIPELWNLRFQVEEPGREEPSLGVRANY